MLKASLPTAMFLERQTDVRRDSVKGRSVWQVIVLRTEAQAKAVTREARDDVQVDVEDLLTRSPTIGEVEIHALAGSARAPDRGSHPHAGLEEPPTYLKIQRRKTVCVLSGDDQNMTRGDWLDVHERQHVLVAIDYAGWRLPLDDVTEDAVRLSHRSIAYSLTKVSYCFPERT